MEPGCGQLTDLDILIAEITVDANGEDEPLWAFRQALEDAQPLPADAFVIGEPVAVIAFDYDGNERRGLTARCRRPDGSKHVVAAAEIVFPGKTNLAVISPPTASGWGSIRIRPGRQLPHVLSGGRDQGWRRELASPVELAVVSVKAKAARCRLSGSGSFLTLRTSHSWDLVPGEIVTVLPRKQWRYAGQPCLSGELMSVRLDVAVLDLVSLRLERRDTWDPKEEYWSEERASRSTIGPDR